MLSFSFWKSSGSFVMCEHNVWKMIEMKYIYLFDICKSGGSFYYVLNRFQYNIKYYRTLYRDSFCALFDPNHLVAAQPDWMCFTSPYIQTKSGSNDRDGCQLVGETEHLVAGHLRSEGDQKLSDEFYMTVNIVYLDVNVFV